MEGLAVLRIIKHCSEFSPALVTGQLLGLDVGSVLEVTNCFPFPIREEDEEIEVDGANYKLEMMRCLREVNVANNTVGWYQSTLLGSFQTVELIETFMNYQGGEHVTESSWRGTIACRGSIKSHLQANTGAISIGWLPYNESDIQLLQPN